MEEMVMFSGVYKDSSVLVTGHTGFKGGWLSQWLLDMGAMVSGLALEPDVQILYDRLNLRAKLTDDIKADITECDLHQIVGDIKPAFIFHLAAQPIVNVAYSDPYHTFQTNVLGTTRLLDAIRTINNQCVVVVVTTDKVYENQEWLAGYREQDALGGYDPYSASKACVEIVASSYRRSYFTNGTIKLATARAGNIIGGGDWSVDRIVPDCIKALREKSPIIVRNKSATRPWQHVLEALSGYLWLAATMHGTNNTTTLDSFNFGPDLHNNVDVGRLVSSIVTRWGYGSWKETTSPNHEAGKLNLSIDKAFHLLDWFPVLDFDTMLDATVDWYKESEVTADMSKFTSSQIAEYCVGARRKGLMWAQ